MAILLSRYFVFQVVCSLVLVVAALALWVNAWWALPLVVLVPLVAVGNALVGAGLRARIKLGASGKLVTAFDLCRVFAIGADFALSARSFMFAVGCIQSRSCHTNHCPTGVATQSSLRQRALVVADKAPRVANFHRNTLRALAELLGSAGLGHPDQLKPWHLQIRHQSGADAGFGSGVRACLLCPQSFPVQRERLRNAEADRMYKKVLLAYDGSLEGAIALREGAILARQAGADVYLLSVVPHLGGLQVAEGLHGGAVAHELDKFREVLERGVGRLKQLGMQPVAKLAVGDPARVIGEFAREVGADLVVVGHRKRNMLERWWSGTAGAYISDNIGCSLLIARNAISDAALDSLSVAKAEPAQPAAEGADA